MSNTIYLVKGKIGRHPDDETEWVVKAFLTREKAQECADKALTEYERIQERWRNTHTQSWEKQEWETNAHDPHMIFRGFGEPVYYVEEIELVEE